MNPSSANVFVNLGNKRMAAILRDDKTKKYFYQVVTLCCLGIEKDQIKVDQCVGPYENFVSVSSEVDKLREIK